MEAHRVEYSEELATRICFSLVEGKSLMEILRADGMPCRATIYNWLDAHPEFARRYARAREWQAHELAERAILMGMQGERVILDPNAARVQLDAIKWAAAKLGPKQYGEKQTHAHTGADGEGPAEVVHRHMWVR